MAAEKAESMGCGECVFHRGDVVTECAHSNVSIIKDGIFKTHPTDHYILPGITRMHIIQICKDNGIPVDETPFTMAELMDADEIIVSQLHKILFSGLRDERNSDRRKSSGTRKADSGKIHGEI